jgi:hypothetical protein
MFAKQLVTAVGTVAGFAGLVLAGTLLASPRVHGDDDRSSRHADDEHGSRHVDEEDSSSDEWQIELGLQIAPVQLTYGKHDRKLVGLGSYLVNAVSECNGCHSAGPATQYVTGHNPFQRLGPFTPPKMANPETYLGGGRDFLQIGPITSSTIPPHIVSRNLTPDKTGLAQGGATFGEFFDIIRNGTDHDHLHPNCSATRTDNCFNPPFNGDLLQVMPWPAYQDWTDHDLLATYEYLKAIPCIAGTPLPDGSRDLTTHLCP